MDGFENDRNQRVHSDERVYFATVGVSVPTRQMGGKELTYDWVDRDRITEAHCGPPK